ncbi:MAG TPA: HD domain-containing phosphohydrolase, partial [Thermoleophilaceae bacterium]|nr:HD domain-containing phosphohydrolase [Thermoleophilaceae bacterium]
DASLYEAKHAGGMVHGAGELIGEEHAPPLAETARQRERLASASRLAAKLAPLLDPGEIARTAVDELEGSFEYLIAVIHRVDDDGHLRPEAGAGPLIDQMSDFDSWAQSLEEGIVGRAARSGEPVLVRDTRREPDFLATDAPVNAGSELAAPIRVGGEVWGVLNLEHEQTDGFDPDDVLFADMIAAAVGAAIHRCHLFSELEGAFLRTLAALSNALEAKDAATASHARGVAGLSERVGARLGMTMSEVRTLSFAALLHDIGKIGIRTDLLKRPGSLTGDEFEEIRRHTEIGVEMLEPLPYFGEVHPLVRSVHERWDGHGYPDGLTAEEIPLGARIIAACDALHAMTSNRPYRRALPMDAALDELRDNAGTQFDPSVVDALVAILSAEPVEGLESPPRLPERSTAAADRSPARTEA